MKIFILMVLVFLIFCICLVFIADSKPCGNSRWSVKCLNDYDSFHMNFIPDTFNFDSLTKYDVFVKTKYNTPRLPDERKVIVINLYLMSYIEESDHDVHLICRSIYDSSKFIICEIPSVEQCIEVKNSLHANSFINSKQYISSLHQYVVGRWNFFNKPVSVWLTGVLYHDFPHNNGKYHMPNFLEIHPVLNIDSLN